MSPAQAHIILRLLSFPKQAEEQKGHSVPETFASMIQTWWDPLDKTHRLMLMFSCTQLNLKYFTLGKITLRNCLVDTCLSNLPSFLHCYQAERVHIGIYLIKMLIIFTLYAYQHFVKCRTVSSRSKPSKAKAKFTNVYDAERVFLPTPGLSVRNCLQNPIWNMGNWKSNFKAALTNIFHTGV